MNTAIKNNRPKHSKPEPLMIEKGKPMDLSPDQIVFSPLNYRKYFSEEDLNSFAGELKLHGVISPLTVRRLGNGNYELVAGERRLRAARMTKLKTVPVIVKQLTDTQVTEIQLAENLQRENPHPMNEAHAISLMQHTGKNIEEIAARLGKSKQFVYIRLKLLNLIEVFQEMFFADVLTIQQAVEIANISSEGQQEFFEQHCIKWKKQKDFRINNLEYYLRQYKYDLRNAPFNTKDKKLIPEVGGCSTCSFNSATLKSLFPEYAKQAICTNTACYQNKCRASLRIGLMMALNIHQPAALLVDGELSTMMEELVSQIKEAADLPRYDRNEVTILTEPEEPKKDDYLYDYGDDEPEFKKDDYEEALKDYETSMTEYLVMKESGEFQKALIEQSGDFIPVLFSPEPPPKYNNNFSGKGLTMKSVQEALKVGTATPEMLNEAIEGIKQREVRAKEIDKDKIHLNIHKEFSERIRNIEFNQMPTEIDVAAARLIIFQSMDYDTKRTVEEVLFSNPKQTDEDSHEQFFQKLLSLKEQEHSYLIRMAISCKSDSKYPRNETGYILYKVAEAAGINVTAIVTEQEEKIATRNERIEGRIKELTKKKEKLKKKS